MHLVGLLREKEKKNEGWKTDTWRQKRGWVSKGNIYCRAGKGKRKNMGVCGARVADTRTTEREIKRWKMRRGRREGEKRSGETWRRR